MASRKSKNNKRKRKNTRKKGGRFGFTNPHKTYADNLRNCKSRWSDVDDCTNVYNIKTKNYPGWTNGPFAKVTKLDEGHYFETPTERINRETDEKNKPVAREITAKPVDTYVF